MSMTPAAVPPVRSMPPAATAAATAPRLIRRRRLGTSRSWRPLAPPNTATSARGRAHTSARSAFVRASAANAAAAAAAAAFASPASPLAPPAESAKDVAPRPALLRLAALGPGEVRGAGTPLEALAVAVATLAVAAAADIVAPAAAAVTLRRAAAMSPAALPAAAADASLPPAG